MGSYFGIGLGCKVIALGNEFFLEFQIVFDDAVMQQRYMIGTVGMGIDVAGDAMGSPTGMGNAAGTGQRGEGKLFLQLLDAALGFYGADDAILKNRDARRIIAAVFQVAQSFQQYFGGLSEATVSNYTTHNRITPYSVLKVHIYKAISNSFLCRETG